MIKRAVNFLKLSLSKLTKSLQRFPEAIFFCFFTSAMLIYINHIPYSVDQEVYQRIAMVTGLGVPINLCLKLTFEKTNMNSGSRWLLSLLGILFLPLYYHYLLNSLDYVSNIRYLALSVALYLVFLVIPYLSRRPGIELYVMKLTTLFFVTYIYSLFLYLGLAAILATLNILFSINISFRVYTDIFLIVAGIFAPASFLADVPLIDDEIELESYSRVLEILLTHIIMPILIVYTSILYIFFLKTLLTRQWPQGMVSNLVLWYSFISTLVVFLVYPLRKENRWVDAFTNYLPKAILPLLGIMFVSMGIRIKAYGITENRYLVLASGLWVTGTMIYLALKKKQRNIIPIIALALVLVLSVVGPWSSFNISRLSQNKRFEELLEKHDMIQDGVLAKASHVPPDHDRYEITQIIRYFEDKHHIHQLKYMPDDFAWDKMVDTFGFEATYNRDGEKYFHHYLAQDKGITDISDYDYFIPADAFEGQNPSITGVLDIHYLPSSGEIEVFKGSKVLYTGNIREMASEIHLKNKDREELSRREMSFIDENEYLRTWFSIESFGGNMSTPTGHPQVDWIRFHLFIKLK